MKTDYNTLLIRSESVDSATEVIRMQSDCETKEFLLSITWIDADGIIEMSSNDELDFFIRQYKNRTEDIIEVDYLIHAYDPSTIEITPIKGLEPSFKESIDISSLPIGMDEAFVINDVRYIAISGLVQLSSNLSFYRYNTHTGDERLIDTNIIDRC